jgi:hypothetical protein
VLKSGKAFARFSNVQEIKSQASFGKKIMLFSWLAVDLGHRRSASVLNSTSHFTVYCTICTLAVCRISLCAKVLFPLKVIRLMCKGWHSSATDCKYFVMTDVSLAVLCASDGAGLSCILILVKVVC